MISFGFSKQEKLGLAIILISLCLALFVGGFLCFIKPIYEACCLFDKGQLTGTFIFWMIIKIIAGWFASGFIYLAGLVLGKYIIEK